MTSTSGSAFYDYGSPPYTNPNRPRRGIPSTAPYNSGSAGFSGTADEYDEDIPSDHDEDIPDEYYQDMVDGYDDDIADAFAGMDFQDQRNPMPRGRSGRLSHLDSGRSVSQAYSPLIPINCGYPGLSSGMPTSQNMPSAIHTPASVANQAPNSAYSQTPSTSGRWWMRPNPYLNSQHGSASEHSSSSSSSSLSSGTSRPQESTSHLARFNQTSLRRRQARYRNSVGHYPVVEHRYQFAPPPQPSSRTVQVSETRWYGTTTYTEHEEFY